MMKMCIPVVLVLMAGCESPKAAVQSADVTRETVVVEVAAPKGHRVLTAKQETMLREFALKESPQLWRTVQALRGEIENRGKSLAQLAADLKEFDRDPSRDPTYRELAVGREQIACTLDNVYQKLEDAYIAYKKFQTTPGQREYADTMKRALEDGVQEAEATARRFNVMALNK